MKFLREMFNSLNTKEGFANLVTLVLIILSFRFIEKVTFTVIPKENQRFADIILGGIIVGVLGTICNYLYGSNKDSKDKNQMLHNLINNTNSSSNTEPNVVTTNVEVKDGDVNVSG